jgi:hypothetical protein
MSRSLSASLVGDSRSIASSDGQRPAAHPRRPLTIRPYRHERRAAAGGCSRLLASSLVQTGYMGNRLNREHG